jgi:hypothetical protein
VAGNGNSYTAEYWQYDSRLGRRWNLDPKPNPSISYYACFGNNPILITDINGDTTYKFNLKGEYIGMTDLDQAGHKGTYEIIEIVSQPGLFNYKIKTITKEFSFAYPVNDPKAIQNNKITKIRLVTDEEIHRDLTASGAYNKDNHGIITGSKYLNDNSDASKNTGKTDFVISSQIEGNGNGLSDNTLYIPIGSKYAVAHNNYNFGNFLWGAAASALGVPEGLAKAGAHYNNYMSDPTSKGRLDSADDQLSIGEGFKWQSKHPPTPTETKPQKKKETASTPSVK